MDCIIYTGGFIYDSFRRGKIGVNVYGHVVNIIIVYKFGRTLQYILSLCLLIFTGFYSNGNIIVPKNLILYYVPICI